MSHRPPIFKGTVANGETKYVPAPIAAGHCGGQIAWLDATSAATITLEWTCFDQNDAPLTEAGAAYEWKDSGVTIVGPTGAAAGSAFVNCTGVCQTRGRYKIVATAACSFEIYNGVHDV